MSKRTVVYDASDLEQIKAARRNEETLEGALKSIAETQMGRAFLFDLIYNKCHVGAISHVPRDTHSTAFNEGARSVGQALLDEIAIADRKLLLKMLDENS